MPRTSRLPTKIRVVVAPLLLGCALASCSDGGDVPPGPETGADCPYPESFESTFAAIQSLVFERRGCTQSACHGDAAKGGLDLSPGVAYRNLLEVQAEGSTYARIEPGSPNRSYLFLKLGAATDPGSVEIAGAPMPNGLPPLTADELEAVRLWIKAGAPETGSIGDADTGSSAPIERMLGACLPEAEPITIDPLAPPATDEGVQLAMPEWLLPAKTETEVCFATYYDFTAQVPREFQDPTGTYFRYAVMEMRQDPQSHHLVLDYSGLTDDQIHHPSLGDWACRGGEHDGETCEPTDLGACGAGLCATAPRPLTACIGFGPRSHFLSMGTQGIGGGQTSQAREEFGDGVFQEVPLRGVFYWNSHAFNLTTKDHPMNARINYLFARDQRHRMERIPVDVARVYAAAGTPPFTEKTICADYTLPRGARLIELTSHTHKRGRHFTADLPGGTRIYESFVYSDPVYQRFDPPLAFDSADAAERTLHYCGTYNNGVANDGSADPETVTRASRMPDATTCRPVACAEGRVGAPCAGANDDATCDTQPEAGDGRCDACAITAGVTTENEMFILLGWYYLPDR